MRLDEFTYVPSESREKALRFLAYQIGDPNTDLQVLMAQVDQAFTTAHADGEVIYQASEEAEGGQPDAALFSTGFTTAQGEEVMGKCMINKRTGALQKWFGLFFQTARREGFNIGDMYFRTWTDGQRFLEEVAAMAITERWTYQDYPSRQPHPILKCFLEHTQARLKLQDRIIRTDGHALFNTGLINKFFKEIYVVTEIDPEVPNRLVNPRPVLENDRVILDTFRNKKPEMVTFFSRITDVIFDPELEINTDDSHIVEENFDRIPEVYRQMRKSQIFALFQAAVQFARVMAARNYKLIVPHVYRGKIQFLMPIYLSGEFAGPPDLALVLEKIGDCYRGNTILTLDMAYQNARLIARPEASWLTTDLQPAG
jgi:hypothetical protein